MNLITSLTETPGLTLSLTPEFLNKLYGTNYGIGWIHISSNILPNIISETLSYNQYRLCSPRPCPEKLAIQNNCLMAIKGERSPAFTTERKDQNIPITIELQRFIDEGLIKSSIQAVGGGVSTLRRQIMKEDASILNLRKKQIPNDFQSINELWCKYITALKKGNQKHLKEVELVYTLYCESILNEQRYTFKRTLNDNINNWSQLWIKNYQHVHSSVYWWGVHGLNDIQEIKRDYSHKYSIGFLESNWYNPKPIFALEERLLRET